MAELVDLTNIDFANRLAALKEKIAEHRRHLAELDKEVYVAP